MPQAAPPADRFRTPPVVWWIIAANVAVAFLQLTVVPPAAMLRVLGFHVGDLQGAWWSVGTYMFVHAGFWHLALNMWMLWLFGSRVAMTQRPGQFLGFYMLCGLGGWFFHVLFTPQGLLVGASAAVMGVLFAFAARWPDEEVRLFGVVPVTVRWLVAILVLVNLLGGMSSTSGAGVAYLAHLGGLATAWAALRLSGAVALDGAVPRVAPVVESPEDFTTRAVPHRFPRARPEREKRGEVDDIVAQSQAALAEVMTQRDPVPPPAARPAPTADVNRVLDKISAQGLAALSDAERKILEDAARRLRDG